MRFWANRKLSVRLRWLGPGKLPENSQVVFRNCRRVACNSFGNCVSLLREPDAANPHVRFDERGVKTEARFR